MLGGYWIIDVASKKEAVGWAKRCPGGENETLEIRQMQQFEEFPDDVKKAAAKFNDMQTAADQRRKTG